ncbi:RasGEF domain protein [Legionella massiliensis]|uniref:RasGEF domain protein n=1 Tax=Legionella massiliensis TaxID=1034943 RepID=A0A078KUI7_9GAMM|nr:RasGEF domain-containing protein [Legionella massiliensis]CDZ78115.1 RasGEF domain protein [Legionella massiliensis]CEE13853.1 RasGEF domain protein [Legionella massiliensis]
MNKALRQKYIDVLTEHQNEYLKKYESLQQYLNAQLPETFEFGDLELVRARVRKEHLALKKLYEEIQKIHATLKDNAKNLPRRSLRRFEEFSEEFNARFTEANPDCKSMFQQINAQKEEIKASKDPVQILNKLVEKYKAASLTIKEYNEFLCNPLIKSKVKSSSSFAARVKEFNKQIIDASANTIAEIDQELFLNIKESDLLSPWAYKNSETLLANSTHHNNLADLASRDILRGSSVEERTITAERWIGVASSLFEVHKDYNGCMAILLAFSRVEISRLNKTMGGLSKESQETLAKLSEVVLVPQALKPIFNAQQAVIPALPMFQRDMTFLHDGNVSVSSLEDDEAKRSEMAERTGGGRKIMRVFTKLQKERANTVISGSRDVNLNSLLRDLLDNPGPEYDSEKAYQRSQQLEPAGNSLQVAKIIKLGKTVKSSTNSQPVMRQVMLQELIHELNHSPLVNDISAYLRAKNQELFQMDESCVIDWEQEKQLVEPLKREVEAYVEEIQGFLTNEKNSNLVKQGNELINHLQSIDFMQAKMNSLERTLSAGLYKLRIEFTTLTKLKADPTDPKFVEVEAELTKISKLQESCQFSDRFLAGFADFKEQFEAFKQLTQQVSEDKENALDTLEVKLPRASQCRYSLLFNSYRPNIVSEEALQLHQTAAAAC